ncbi:DUF1932 domain-containing protein [Streptomyces sp. NPDC048192]|uniref:DUF1932 domain-containing protein n=1 Tax=Streptomyces sp. NPDC048192 TaxID=3365510 RepID=UPI00371F21A9
MPRRTARPRRRGAARHPSADPRRPAGAGPHAWRWEPEMREIADTCEAAGIPGDFARTAARTSARWDHHKDDHTVTGARLLADLRQPPGRE